MRARARAVVTACLVLNACSQGVPETPEAPVRALPAEDPAPAPDARVPPPPSDADRLELLRPPARLQWPVEDVHLTSRFGWRTDPVSGAGLRLHRGVDLRGATGDFVLAAGEARVEFSGWDPLLGELIILDHGDGLETWYAHLSSRLVYEGLRVRTGSAIGNVGNTGRSAAPHLHLTVKLDGEAVEPLPYFQTPGARSY